MLAIFDAIAPVFLVILAGVLVERAGMLARETGRIVSVLVVNVTLPCLLFNLMTQVTVEQLSRGWWWFATAFLPLVILWSWAGVELLRKVPFGPAVIFGFSTVFFNAAFVGLPVVMNLFPGNPQAMTVAGLCVVASNSAGLTGQICLDAWNRHRREGAGGAKEASPQGGFASSCWRLFRQYVLGNTVLVATIIGLTLAVLEIPLWKPAAKAVHMLGMLSPTAMLFVFGFNLCTFLQKAASGRRGLFFHSFLVSLAKLLGFPAATWACLAHFGYSQEWLAVTVVMCATGTGIVTSVFAEVYGAEPEETALTVAVTNVMSFFSLLFFVWLLKGAGHMA